MFTLSTTHWRGLSLALLAMASFSIASIGTKMSLNISEVNFYSLAIFGWGLGMIGATFGFYLPQTKYRRNLVPQLQKHIKFFSIIAVLTVINGGTWFYGLSQISGGVVALIDQNVIIWTFILGAIFLGERFSWRQLCAISLTVLGLIIVSNIEGEVTLVGVLSLLTCGLSIALQSLLIKKYKPTFDALALTFWRGWCMVLVSLGLALGLGVFETRVSLEALVLVGVAQFFGLFVGRAAYIKAHEYLPISHLSFLMLGIPMTVLIASFFVLDEPFSWQKVFGASLMLIGLAWFFTRRALRQTETSLKNAPGA